MRVDGEWGWPALWRPPVEGPTISLSSQVLHRFGSALARREVSFLGFVSSFPSPVR
jgi:hypothetical protein